LVGDLEIKKRPLENGVVAQGKVTHQYGHILHARPAVAKVPVAAAAPTMREAVPRRPVIK
jgi:hypothetical protein